MIWYVAIFVFRLSFKFLANETSRCILFGPGGDLIMPISCTNSDRTLLASIYGDIDHHGAKGIMMELEQQIDRALPRQLILDCSGITFMDSSGIAVLLRAYNRMRSLNGSISATGIPAQPAKVLRAAGLDRLISLE
jgi:stage II sporulation protein AA (anti-sigma F factor antagonist)